MQDTNSLNSAPIYNVDFLAYIGAGVLGAYIWDVFSNIGYDFKLLHGFSCNVNAPVIVYFLSRASTLLLSALILALNVTSDTTRCVTLYTVVLWMTAVSVSTTSLLFFLRVNAIYKDCRPACIFFFISWVCIVAATVIQTQLGHIVVVPNDIQRCTIIFNEISLVVAAIIVPMINDILVFLAITHRMMVTALVDTSAAKTKAMVAIFGHYLPAFSKTLLQDGQAYFFTLIPIYITAVIYLTIPQVASSSITLTYPAMVVANLMACKVYRKTKLGIRTVSDSVPSKPILPIAFAQKHLVCEG